MGVSHRILDVVRSTPDKAGGTLSGKAGGTLF